MPVFTILERLAPHVERELNLILNTKHEAETLKSKLERIHDGLQDAERHGVTDKNVKRWLGELEDVMYEMDDALDQWETKNIELQMEQSECDYVFDPWEKVRSLLLSVCSSFKHVIGRRKLTKEMIALSGRLDKILEDKGRYSFVTTNRNMSYNSSQLEKPETTSSVDKSKAHGRKYDTDSLVDLLLSKGECSGALVVSIVGIGGLGKTTLAQLVYNDPRVEEHFGRLKAWVSVPDPFDASRIAKAIVGTFDRSSSGDSRLEKLGQRIKAIASNKNFLLVLDNVWTVDRHKWESLKNFLVGFRILVTTRDAIAARTIGTTHWPRLDLLSDSDCATILNTIALKESITSGEKHEEFREIGFEIAKKCNGLPLAAKTIGHALESRSTIQGWRDVLESPLWKYEDEMRDIFRPLRLSYMDLSPLLKRCFLSCALYSKGFKFDSEGLMRIWMAQGYVDSSVAWDQVLLKGEQYLKQLSDRSFFQESGSNNEGNLTFKMHDIMYDFGSYLSRSEFYVIVDGRTDKIPYRMGNGGRIRYFSARFVSQKDLPQNLFSLLKRARVLCLSDCDLEELSRDVGKLFHLRYLDLSGNLLTELPETVSDLCNLQTLDLRRCRYLTRLPRGLKKLIKLRHLLISETESLLEFEEELSKLTGLWTLDKCTAARDSLLHFNQLKGSPPIFSFYQMDEADMEKGPDTFRCVSFLGCLLAFKGSDEEVAEAPTPSTVMVCKNDIEEEDKSQDIKHFNYSSKAKVSEDTDEYESETEDSSESLSQPGGSPPRASCFYEVADMDVIIESVEVAEASTRRQQMPPSPSRIATKYLNNVRALDINGSQYSSLPQLGVLPMLVTLRIHKMEFKTVTLEAGFPKLETLTFSECELWQEWEDVVEEEEATADSTTTLMPCLNYLAITLCPNLKALPHRLLHAAKSLQQLFVAGCPRLASAYHKELGADWDHISHIPDTIILASY